MKAQTSDPNVWSLGYLDDRYGCGSKCCLQAGTTRTMYATKTMQSNRVHPHREGWICDFDLGLFHEKSIGGSEESNDNGNEERHLQFDLREHDCFLDQTLLVTSSEEYRTRSMRYKPILDLWSHSLQCRWESLSP